MRLPTLPRRRGRPRRRKHGGRRGAARPRQRHGPELFAGLPLRPAVSVAGPQRARRPLRSDGDRAAWPRRGAATDVWSRAVARARGDLRGSRARGGVRLVTARVPHHPRTHRSSAPIPRCRCHTGPPPTSTILAGRPAYVLLRDSGRRRGTRRRSQAGGLGAGPERKRILAAWVHSARRLAGDHCRRKPQATSRKCGNHAIRGIGTPRVVRRGCRRHHLHHPPPSSTFLPNLAFGPGAGRHRGEILGAMLTARPRAGLTCAALAGLLLVAGCERPVGCTGDYCGTMVIASGGEPDILLPPVSEFSITRDVTDQLFLKLAELGASGNTIGDEDFQPQLAQRWEWDTPTTLVFHLDPRARWQDGQTVTAADVAFTYDAYTDTLVNSSFRSSLRQIAAVTTRDSLTVVFLFRQRYPEMFYDAVYHLRILPAHLLREVPRDQWRSAAFGRAPVGDGPYRFVAWKAGESIELTADSTFFLGRPHLRRVIWRFTPDQQGAVTQLITGDADAVEVLVTPDNVQRAREDTALATYPYKGSAYGYVGFNLAAPGDSTKPHPLFGDRDLRRALVMATDRERVLRNVFGDLAKVPPGPLSQVWWIWDPEIRELPYDSGQAARLLTRTGWIDADGDGIRDRDGHPLAFRLLVPTTSAMRRAYARLLQEQFRTAGVDVQLDEVDFSLYNERARAGRFDALLNVWNTDPTPSSGFPQTWTPAGVGRCNYCRSDNPEVDRLGDQAVASAANRDQARRAWRAAVETLNRDAPGIFLFEIGRASCRARV